MVVVHSLWVIADYPLPTNCPESVFTQPLIRPIDGHEHHDIVFLFHRKDTKRHIVKITVQCIHANQIIVIEVSLDITTIDIA